jgi:hypothetical protein
MRSMASVGVLGLIVAAAGVGAGQAPATRAADLALVGGRIYTVDNAKPWAEAVSLTNDRIVAGGTNAEIRALAWGLARIWLDFCFGIIGFKKNKPEDSSELRV